ncbi:subfamily S1A unassigned peptidase (S01 family) [Schistosoma mansoni]|uniref:Acrosin n=1 Tax=Schistosoma mansoni TaxID=6183 RepID=C4Q5F5_SCHMA|nr:subfamily S1A unassigned peptidase (S01 family) [Schistosoma mansoni]|eukprot:XP_018644186.1 subfamily S1A unassigned peptidase (S01 family) [Schistosoma mansoni]
MLWYNIQIQNSLSIIVLVLCRFHCLICFPIFDTECGSTPFIFSPNGNIYSHKGYEKQLAYDGLIQCFWLIHVNPQDRIIIQSVDFDLAGDSIQCDEDSLTVYEPEDYQVDNITSSEIDTFTKRIGKYPYCGLTSFRVLSSSNQLFLVFKARSTGKHNGFNLRYSAINNNLAKIVESSSQSITVNRTCDSSFEWKCPTSQCILKIWRCDGFSDCSGSEDEINCLSPLSKISRLHSRQKRSVYDNEENWGRVVNGQPAPKGAWAFIVSLRFSGNGGHVCAGSLISAQWVMTAAHCIQPMPDPKRWFVDVGRYYRNFGGPEVQRIKLSQIVIHPSYNKKIYANDIALLRLQTPANLDNRQVRLSPVPRNPHLSDLLTDNVQCMVAGWGDTHNTGSNDVLRQAVLPVINYDLCKSWYQYLNKASFCAGYKQGGIDACQGDSGGPLLCYVGGQTVQAGIVSWGNDCAKPRNPGVYTNVAMFSDWYSSVL